MAINLSINFTPTMSACQLIMHTTTYMIYMYNECDVKGI